MDATIANSAMHMALTLIEMREPIPLAWAIEHGEQLPELWASVTDPFILFGLFSELGGELDPMTMVRVLARMLRSILPAANRGDGPTFRSLAASEAWTRGEASVEDVYRASSHVFARREFLKRNLYRQPAAEEFVREKFAVVARDHLFADAVYQIGYNIYRESLLGEQFRDILKAVLAVGQGGSFGETAAILREYLPQPTLAMLVEATTPR
jgi:hypothetical protein